MKMNEIIISYRKSLVKSKKPGVVKVGSSEIYSDNIILAGNILGHIQFKPENKNRHGTTMPLIIKIQYEVKNWIVVKDEIKDLPKKVQKRLIERARYQKNHITIFKPRKSLEYD